MKAWTLLIFLIPFGASFDEDVIDKYESDEEDPVKKDGDEIVEDGFDWTKMSERQMQLSCLYKTNATVTAIVSQFHKFDASNEVKCFIDCYLGYKNITESEKIIPNGLRKAYNDTLKPEVIKRYEDRCEKWLGIRHKETKCHFAWRVARCYRFRFKDIRPPNRRKSY